MNVLLAESIKNKKILMICLDMDPMSNQGDQHTGAAHLYVKETLDALGEANVETLAITRLNHPKKLLTEKLSETVQLRRIVVGDADIQPKEFLWGREQEILNKIFQLLEENQFSPDVIHSVYWYSGKVGLEISNRLNVPHAYSIISIGKVKHDALNKTLVAHDVDRETIEKECFKKSKVIFSVCTNEKNDLLRLYPAINEDKVVVVGRGVDPNLFNNRNATDEKSYNFTQPYLFFAARLIPSKGLKFLSEVYLRILEDPTVIQKPKLIIAGGTDQEVVDSQTRVLTNKILRTAHEKGLIRWLGSVPRDQMPHLFRNALATCVSSMYEPGARVIIESMACGTPVIMTETGYANEVVFSGVNGYVAPYGNHDLWVQYIKTLMASKVWHEKLSSRTRYTVFPYFSLDEFGKRHIEAYQHIWKNAINKELFCNKAIFGLEYIYPNWDIPNSMIECNETPTDYEILDWCHDLGLGGKLSQVPVDDIASSHIYSLSTENGLYIIKRPKPKQMFFELFYPINDKREVHYRSSKARWKTEVAFSQEPLFQIPIAYNERLALIMNDNYRPRNFVWNGNLILNLFAKVRQFQIQQAYKYKSFIRAWEETYTPKRGDLDWNFLREYDKKLNSLNSKIRDNEIWFTPAEAHIELQRIGLYLKSSGFPLPSEYVKKIIHQNETIYETLVDIPARFGIVWGGCRPEHVIEVDYELFGIDAESCLFGESEIDFAQFLWWFIGLRTRELNSNVLNVINQVLDQLITQEKTYTVAWLWLTNFFWLWWDIARSRKDRIERFLSFFDAYELLIKKVVV